MSAKLRRPTRLPRPSAIADVRLAATAAAALRARMRTGDGLATPYVMPGYESMEKRVAGKDATAGRRVELTDCAAATPRTTARTWTVRK